MLYYMYAMLVKLKYYAPEFLLSARLEPATFLRALICSRICQQLLGGFDLYITILVEYLSVRRNTTFTE